MLFHAPSVLATQERFSIFRRVTQNLVANGKTLASVPCGYMDDLLSLDYSKVKNVNLVGLDIDPEAVAGAQENAKIYGLSIKTEIANAWDLKKHESAFDLISSNGLNIYSRSTEEEEELYKSFATALKPGGVLVTSFLTPPPGSGQDSPWKIKFTGSAAWQKLIFVDILGVGWQASRTQEQMQTALSKAGFTTEGVVYDSQRIFPTLLARLG